MASNRKRRLTIGLVLRMSAVHLERLSSSRATQHATLSHVTCKMSNEVAIE